MTSEDDCDSSSGLTDFVLFNSNLSSSHFFTVVQTESKEERQNWNRNDPRRDNPAGTSIIDSALFKWRHYHCEIDIDRNTSREFNWEDNESFPTWIIPSTNIFDVLSKWAGYNRTFVTIIYTEVLRNVTRRVILLKYFIWLGFWRHFFLSVVTLWKRLCSIT